MLYVNSGTPKEVRKAIRTYLASLVPSGPYPTYTVRKVHEGMPNGFEDMFPAFVLQSTGRRGEHRMAEGFPARLTYQARALQPVMGPWLENEQETGLRNAEDVCLEIIEDFVYTLGNDDDFQVRIQDLEIGSSSNGTSDVFGTPRLDRSGNLLWAESIDLAVVL